MNNKLIERIGEQLTSFELFKIINFINESKKYNSVRMICEDEYYCIIIEKNNMFLNDIYIGLDLEPENLEREQRIIKEDNIIYDYYKYWRNNSVSVGEPKTAFEKLCEVALNEYLSASKKKCNVEMGLESNLYSEYKKIKFIKDNIDNYFFE
ncbi:MAG: hypothetical protein ACRCWM_11860 [Sarcina sp.]